MNKSRKIEEKRRKEERKKAEELARKLAEQDDEAEESEGDEIYGGKDLAGMRGSSAWKTSPRARP